MKTKWINAYMKTAEVFKTKWINAYMKTAEVFAQLSSAKILQVGAVIVKDHRIISIGYNGTPEGWDNCCEDILPDGTLVTRPEVFHAEANAVCKLARDSQSGLGATLFCTHAPCISCAKLIYGAGIKRVFYRDSYKCDSGVKFLRQTDVDVIHHPNNE